MWNASRRFDRRSSPRPGRGFVLRISARARSMVANRTGRSRTKISRPGTIRTTAIAASRARSVIRRSRHADRFQTPPLPHAGAGRRRGRGVRPARLALVADALRDHQRGLRWPAGLQQLRCLPVRLPARLAERCLGHALAEGDRRRSGAAHECPRRPDRNRRSGPGHRGGLHRSDDEDAALSASRRRDRRRERGRHAAIASQFGKWPASAWTGELERHGRPPPDASRFGDDRSLDRRTTGNA